MAEQRGQLRLGLVRRLLHGSPEVWWCTHRPQSPEGAFPMPTHVPVLGVFAVSVLPQFVTAKGRGFLSTVTLAAL
ncbi:hypothetical protein LE181_02310 [Streptomyces sp. SCA3-4]|uniref:hypothetical protein n=1 Tax=Streptomyces sichuanensis TaxID=2871810 RepID=UPI001CE34E54|nr:hypothetical protein [Streptomyces sichuanensis]MCA6091007.1 hypothetical protein [Streptomyces sichuanensis]